MKVVQKPVHLTRPQLRPQKMSTPLRAYHAQKYGAHRRGILWDFTFETWWEIWAPYFHMRGKDKNDLCMARNGDEGPYSPSNVYLTTNLGNWRDAKVSQKRIRKRQMVKEQRESEFFYQNKRNREYFESKVQSQLIDAREKGCL